MKPLTQWTSTDAIDFLKKVDIKLWRQIALCAVGSLLVFVIIIIPAWFERWQIKAELQGIEAKVQMVQNLARNETLWQKQSREYQELIRTTREKTYSSVETALLAGEISRLAKESRITIVSSRPHDVNAKFPAPFDKRYGLRSYQFVLNSGYHAFGDFLSRIENHPRFLQIQALNMQAGESASSLPKIEISIAAVSDESLPTK